MAPSVTPATSFMTKRLMPKGGVMEAMLSRTVMMTPNQIRSHPKTFAMGTKIGTQMSSSVPSPYAAAFGRREHAAVNAADDVEEDAHDGQPRLERGHPLVEGGFGQPRGEARLEEEHEPHRGHEAQRAVVVPRFLVAGHTVVLEVVQDVPVDVGEIQHEGRPVPLGEFPVRPLDEQVARADFIKGWYLPI